tara:strand:+ start:262 stop:1560 length:1299 start_codon:yes stop_codon:yes gene_type:complete
VIDLQRTTTCGKGLALALLSSALLGCASHPDKIDAAYVSNLKYESYSCAQIATEMENVELRTDALYQQLRRTRRGDNWQAGVGLLLLPTLFALEGGDGVEASEYAFLKGDYEALRYASQQKLCGQQSRSPEEQIEDSLIADTLIALPNNMRVSLSQMIGMLERAHSQGVITDAELIEAQDTAFRLLGSNTQQPTAQELDSLYAIINKTDLGIAIARVDNPIEAPASRAVARQENIVPTAVAERPVMSVASAGVTSNYSTRTSEGDISPTAIAESHAVMEPLKLDSMQSILRHYAHLEGLYIGELPQWKIIRFLEKAGLPSDTPVLGYIDTSVWRSGKNGLLFSENGLYYTNDFVAGSGGSFFASYSDIVVHGAPIYKSRYFYLGLDTLPNRGLIDFVGADTDLEEFSELVLAIKANYQEPEEIIEEKTEYMF